MILKQGNIDTGLLKFDSYWDNLDDVKIFIPENFKKIRQEIRSAIIKTLTDGLEEENHSGRRIRHVLSASEIKRGIDNLLGYEVKKANLYFHLQILEEIDAIRIVDSVSSNKKLTSYYGRTAKAFLLTGKTDKAELTLLEKPELIEFIQKLNPAKSNLEIQAIIDKIMQISEHNTSNIVSWLEKYGEALQNENIDFIEFFKLITFLKIDNPQVKSALNELSILLKL